MKEPVIRDHLPASRRAVLGLAATSLATGTMAAAGRDTRVPPQDASVTPEQFGAVGDGIADDAPAIQRAFDAIAKRPSGGTVILQPKIAYRCGSGLVMDASYVSLWGQALLDFTGWEGRYLHVTASSVAERGKEADNNYGHKGVMSGAIRLRGAGRTTKSIGIDFDSTAVATSAQMTMENVSVQCCGIGIRFGSRSYNNVLTHCEIFDCAVCIDCPYADDNGERTTLVGCVLFNSDLAVRMSHPSGWLDLISCSIDYTRQIYDVRSGHVLAVGGNHESNIWQDCPIHCYGDGAQIRLQGGVIVNQTDNWVARNIVNVGPGALVHLAGTLPQNLILKPMDPNYPSTWARGEGEFRMSDTQTYELGQMPVRLHADRSFVSDPDFRAAAWEDLIWRLHDGGKAIVDRYGRDGDGLRLAKETIGKETGLTVTKATGADVQAAFALVTMPVSCGQMILSGFRVRRDARRPGRDATLHVTPTWLRIDGQDENRLPVIVRSQTVGVAGIVPPTDRFVAMAPMASRTQRTAPAWATHFAMVVDLVKADGASFVFKGLWADAI